MFSLLQSFVSIKKIGFDDVLVATSQPNKYILINTLPSSVQHCLIKHTLPIEMEEQTINDMIHKYETVNKIIVVYGKNSNDETAEKKYKQLISLGLTDVYIYGGGLFEWLLLQDVYGKETFQTTQPSRDILYYRPTSLFK